MSGGTQYRDRDWLRDRYVEDELIAAEIAEKCGCSERTIQRWLKRHEIETRVGCPRTSTGGADVTKGESEYPKLRDKEWLQSQYDGKNKSYADIAEVIGCSKSAVQKWINRHGIQTNTSSEKTPDRLEDEVWLREQYVHKEKSGYEIANELGCGHSTVYSWIREHGIEQQYNGKVSGDEHWWYSGGSRPYGDGWTKNKRRSVRRRDSFTCQDAGCSVTQAEHKEKYGEKLHVHHLQKARDVADAERRNSKENLITLCRDCHRRWEKISDAGIVPQRVTND